MKLGILALQGAYQAHANILEKMGVVYNYVTHPRQLSGIQGLIVPGGESTTMLKLLIEEGFITPLQQFVAAGRHLFGTCAGAILLAKEVQKPLQQSLNFIDVTIERNAYGRQLASHIGVGQINVLTNNEPQNFEMIFIRAPKIKQFGDDVKVFATHQDLPVGVLSHHCMLTTFHPELTSDTRIHQLFVDQISAAS